MGTSEPGDYGNCQESLPKVGAFERPCIFPTEGVSRDRRASFPRKCAWYQFAGRAKRKFIQWPGLVSHQMRPP